MTSNGSNGSGDTRGSGTLRPTRLTLVGGLLVLGGALGWTGPAVLTAFGVLVTPPQWLPAAGLGLFAVLLGAGAVYMYDRVHRRGDGSRTRRVEPLSAFRLLVLAKASAIVGAPIGGWYAGFGARLAVDAPVDPLSRAGSSIGAAVAGVLVVVAALLLERACRLPRDDDPTVDPDQNPDPEKPFGYDR